MEAEQYRDDSGVQDVVHRGHERPPTKPDESRLSAHDAVRGGPPLGETVGLQCAR